ncbi:MAG: 6-carboxytetrahydropterin synthase [Phycisphaerales bacterium]
MRGSNSFAGKPSISGMGRYYEITLSVRGFPDPDTGYLVGIHEIDAIVREKLVPLIAARCDQDPTTDPASMLNELWKAAESGMDHELRSVAWALSPYYCVEMTAATRTSTSVLIRQRFEFAAAHRLHTPALSDNENARFFGKCNNPSGHGHNYRLEPCVRVPLEMIERVNVQDGLQQAVNRVLLERLDHKFLNTDCDWFNQSKGGVISSIENIARVCYQQLAPAISQLGEGIELVSITAWETEKTSAIYPGDAHN